MSTLAADEAGRRKDETTRRLLQAAGWPFAFTRSGRVQLYPITSPHTSSPFATIDEDRLTLTIRKGEALTSRQVLGLAVLMDCLRAAELQRTSRPVRGREVARG